jgi:hypothetical protein
MRWDNGRKMPDFKKKEEWYVSKYMNEVLSCRYDIPVLHGGNDRTPLSYTVQWRNLKKVMSDLRITSSKITHASRGSAARRAAIKG